MEIYIVCFGGVVLYHRLILPEKHALDFAHFFPCWCCRAFPVGLGHANVFPSATVGCHDIKRLATHRYTENAVSSVSVAAVVLAFKCHISVFIQDVQVFHFCHFQS